MKIYNEATGEFIAAKSLSQAREYHVTTLVGPGTGIGRPRNRLYQHFRGALQSCVPVLDSAEFLFLDTDVSTTSLELRRPGYGNQRQRPSGQVLHYW